MSFASEQPAEVGYGKPPVRTRFCKGQSGNPKGVPERASQCGHRT
jgi:hypothetical protein